MTVTLTGTYPSMKGSCLSQEWVPLGNDKCFRTLCENWIGLRCRRSLRSGTLDTIWLRHRNTTWRVAGHRDRRPLVYCKHLKQQKRDANTVCNMVSKTLVGQTNIRKTTRWKALYKMKKTKSGLSGRKKFSQRRQTKMERLRQPHPGSIGTGDGNRRLW